MITKESLALKILELEEVVEMYEKSNRNIHGILYSIGGPLNDNTLEYTRKQLGLFFRISEELILTSEEDD